MKGINSLTEMYSALCAEIPIATDPSTSLDIRTIAKLDMADKVSMNNSLKMHLSFCIVIHLYFLGVSMRPNTFPLY